jgi:AP-3 complex subunit mu
VVTGSNAVVAESLPNGTISNMPWRKAGVKYNQNEIYIDLVEEIDAIVEANGRVVSSDVSGSIQAQSHLSGVPDLLMTFNDPDAIDDCSFHPCVRYARFELDRVVSFVPPDGNFELMRYRVRNVAQIINPPIFCTPQVSFGDRNSTQGHISVSVGVKPISSLLYSGKRANTPMIEEVAVIIPFDRVVRTANLTVNIGTLLYDEAAKVAKWVIGKLDDKRIKPQLIGTMLLSGGAKPEENPPLQLSWKIPQASVSGLTVSGLSLVGESYRPYKGVRAIAKSGRFQIRCS